jgi:hypothetical protein
VSYSSTGTARKQNKKKQRAKERKHRRERKAEKQKIDKEEDKHYNISLVSFSLSLETPPATTTLPP